MKNILIFILALVAIIIATSCGVSRKVDGKFVGIYTVDNIYWCDFSRLKIITEHEGTVIIFQDFDEMAAFVEEETGSAAYKCGQKNPQIY